jgi:hypothetical protein
MKRLRTLMKHLPIGPPTGPLTTAEAAKAEEKRRRTTGVAKFIAHVEFELDAESLRDGRERLRRLSAAAEPVGFRMIRGEVHPVSESPEKPGWTGYGPKIDRAG